MTAAERARSAAPVGGPELGDARELGALVLLPWRRLPFPVPWSDVFGRDAPLHLEIGFGDGRFTVRRAQGAPDADFVGLELSGASVQRALRRVAREGVSNVRLLKAGAEFAVPRLFGPGTLASIVVNFPDPWPKQKHVGNRLLDRAFFRLAASRLAAGGEIRLATDHAAYLTFARAEAEASGVFAAVPGDPPPYVFETKYARKWRAQGKPLHYQVFRKQAEPADAFPVPERSMTMPHALLQGSIPASIPFAKRVAPYGGGHVILHEVAASLGSDAAAGMQGGTRLLVRATVDEPDIRQQLLVVVQQRAADEAIVRIETFGDPIITEAVRGAVHLTTEWLLDATDLALKARNY